MTVRQHFLLPTIFFMFVLLVPGLAQSSMESEPSLEKDAQSLLSAFMSYTDLRIRSLQRSLEILASATEAKSGKWQNMESLLRGYQKSDGGLIVWYVRPDGTYYAPDKGLVNKKLSDRFYFPDLMAGKKVTGALVVSKSTGKRSAIIAVPITKDGKVVGAIGSSLFLDQLAEQIHAMLGLRPGVAFFALAPNGLTTLHRKTDRHFLDPREMGSESLKKATNEILSGTSGKTTYVFDKATKTAIYQTSTLTNWRFVITYSAGSQ